MQMLQFFITKLQVIASNNLALYNKYWLFRIFSWLFMTCLYAKNCFVPIWMHIYSYKLTKLMLEKPLAQVLTDLSRAAPVLQNTLSLSCFPIMKVKSNTSEKSRLTAGSTFNTCWIERAHTEVYRNATSFCGELVTWLAKLSGRTVTVCAYTPKIIEDHTKSRHIKFLSFTHSSWHSKPKLVEKVNLIPQSEMVKESGQARPLWIPWTQNPGYHWMHFTAVGVGMLKFLKAVKEIGSWVP